MKLPSVVHPTTFLIRGIKIQVVSYSQLSNERAGAVAMQFYRSHKFKKKDQGKLFQTLTTL